MATVTVRGRAAADVPPDRVRLSVGVQAEAATGGEAMALVAERAAALDAALAGAGELILLRRPAGVWLNPTWSPTGEVTGQTARRSVVVEARAHGALGELLAALVAVPGASVDGTEWVVDPGNPAHARLRAAAVADGRERAGDYAIAAGARLGGLESVLEPEAARTGGWMPMAGEAVPLMARASKDSGGGPVLELAPEPVEVGVVVDLRWALLTS